MSGNIPNSEETSTAAVPPSTQDPLGLGLICLDFDGTLVDSMHPSDHSVHPSLVRAIERLREEGVVWVINTGRTLSGLKVGLEIAGLPFAPDYVITEETSLLAPCEDHPEGWNALGDWNHQRDHAFRSLLAESGHVFDEIREFVTAHTQAEYLVRTDGLDEIVANSEAEMERICHRIEEVRHAHGAHPLGYQRNTVYLRFGHRGYQKGSTLTQLASYLEIPAQRIFAAGDNLNDLPMLDPEVAGYLACPGNSHPLVQETVRRHGGYLARSRTGEGLTEALRFFGFAG
jgi:HAD superfamily hydrolase (TIGR01484 family)